MTRKKFFLSEDFAYLEDFVKNVQKHFLESNTLIFQARNSLKEFEFEGEKVVVKSFKVPSFFRQIIYSFFRPSKAKRSFLNSQILKNFTPKPMAFIEFYRFFLLKESFFISQKFDYDFTIREPLLEKDFKNRKRVLEEFANFTFLLHEAGIYHKDYSPGNILVKNINDEYIFKVVDVNRMNFFKPNIKQRMKNFAMLWADDEDLKIIAKKYANISNLDEKTCIHLALHFSNQNKKIKNFKKRFRGKQ